MKIKPLTGILLLMISLAGFGADPPHWTSKNTTEDCDTSCHATHTSLGDALTTSSGNVNLCQACHNNSGTAAAMPVNTIDMAVPGTGGYHHAFDVPAVNVTLDTVSPSDTEMSLRVMGGNIVCSTCHDQHDAAQALGGTPHIAPADKLTALGAGTMVSGGTYSGAIGSWYLIEIDGPGDQAAATFRWSKDNGTSWMAQAVSCNNGSPVTLDSGVEVTFSGGAGAFVAGEQWQFYGSWPFLRAELDSGDNAAGVKFCRDCHTNWVMTHTDTRTYDGTAKSHPVGITLGANGETYDRPAPLDGDGTADDGNRSNNLALDAGLVQCMTCHGVHYADSNTLTEDTP